MDKLQCESLTPGPSKTGSSYRESEAKVLFLIGIRASESHSLPKMLRAPATKLFFCNAKDGTISPQSHISQRQLSFSPDLFWRVFFT